MRVCGLKSILCYNHNSKQVGTLCKMWIKKKERKDLQIWQTHILVTMEDIGRSISNV